ncbi:MAG: hypothetical protein EOM83_00315 [Clostridia bacterium]|nr:hypothetical protein [Clostridia bacterium]
MARLFTNPGLKAGVKGNSISVSSIPNKEHVIMSSWKDTDVKVLRAKARGFLTEMSAPALKGGVIEDELHTISNIKAKKINKNETIENSY